MKAHRRQELRENDLAHFIQQTRNYVQGNGSRVLLYVAAGLVVVVLLWVTRQSRQQGDADGWVALSTLQLDDPAKRAENLAQLQQIAENASDGPLALVALTQWGESALRLVLTSDDPADRARYNDEAEQAYKALQQRLSDNPLAIGAALCGLATVEENRFVFNGDDAHETRARKYLEQVRDDARLNGTPFKEQALDRLNTLSDTFTPVTFAPPLPPPVVDQLPPDDVTVEPGDVSDESSPPDEAPPVDVPPSDADGAPSSDAPSSDAPEPPDTADGGRP